MQCKYLQTSRVMNSLLFLSPIFQPFTSLGAGYVWTSTAELYHCSPVNDLFLLYHSHLHISTSFICPIMKPPQIMIATSVLFGILETHTHCRSERQTPGRADVHRCVLVPFSPFARSYCVLSLCLSLLPLKGGNSLKWPLGF